MTCVLEMGGLSGVNSILTTGPLGKKRQPEPGVQAVGRQGTVPVAHPEAWRPALRLCLAGGEEGE